MKIGVWGDGDNLAGILGCKDVKLPIKYLELLLDAKYKDVKTWDPVIELCKRRLLGIENELSM